MEEASELASRSFESADELLGALQAVAIGTGIAAGTEFLLTLDESLSISAGS